MGTKLTEITPSYRTFENDQVLTAGQLNEFLNYFDDQERLSRISLSGVGIVCGFKLNFNQTTNSLTISQGSGVTTDGDLLKLEQTIPDTDDLKTIDITGLDFTDYATFIDDKAVYKPYFYKIEDDTEVQIPLWELLPNGSTSSEGPIANLADLDNKVVLLYLESYEDDGDLCVGVNCDNQGVSQVQNLKVLLVNQEDADHILSFDTIFNINDILSTYYNLSDVVAPRVLIKEVNTQSFSLLNESYNDAIKKDSIVQNMKASFTQMLNKLEMGTTAIEINQLIDSLFAPANLPTNVPYFQYRYDIFKDVVDTYLELKELFLDGSCNCNPDIKAFPKHLFLGKLIPTPEDLLYKNYRHSFYKSPILCCEDDAFSQFLQLINRLKEQLKTYLNSAIPRGPIKITPSRFDDLLGNKAIPFYYQVQNPLLNYWNYEKTVRNQQRRNLSFHRDLLSSAPAIQSPLNYNLEPFNFLRIEGHQGYLYPEAMDIIDQIKQSNGLSFDLKALGITISEDETIDLDDYACEFEDLNALLKAWKIEHECLMGNASYYLSSYSLIAQGVNGRKIRYLNPIKFTLPLNTLGNTAVPLKENPVEQYLDTAENTMGKVVLEAFKTYDGCSANDIIFQINRELTNWDFREWDPVVYDVTINKPMELLAHSFVFLNKFPSTVMDLRPAVMNDYLINAANICSLAKKVQAVSTGEVPPTPAPPYTQMESESSATPVEAKTGNLEPKRLGVLTQEQAMINLLMNQLANICCSTKKIQSIYDEIEERKKRILLNLKLSEFAKAHPGLEHYAGTKQGGTFILAYITTSVNGIPANTVIADFTLPYSCCSDCAPINFIMPRPVATLSLSQDRFCIGNDSSPLVFTPFPLDGEIKSDQTVPGMTINGNQLLIDPLLIPESVYGTPIYFTVNEQITGCNLTFFKSPEFDFEVPESPTSQSLILFQPTGLFETGTTFLWNFGDGDTSPNRAVSHQYQLPVPDNSVTVSLTVTPPSGACPKTIQKTIEFVDFQVSITPMSFCNNDTTIYPFTVTPDGTVLTIEGEGVVAISDGNVGFNPSLVTPGQVAIFVNGVETLELTVRPNPTATISASSDLENLQLNSAMANVDFYVWSFIDASGNQAHEDIVDYPNPLIPWDSLNVTTWPLNIKLLVDNACSAESEIIQIPAPLDFAACSTANASIIEASLRPINTFKGSPEYNSLTEAQHDMFNKSLAIFSEVNENVSGAMDGSLNEALGSLIVDILNTVQNEIITVYNNTSLSPEVKASQLKGLITVYGGTGYSLMSGLIVCQTENTIEEEVMKNVFDLMVTHLDPANSNSFAAKRILPDPSRSSIKMLDGAKKMKVIGSYSWNILNQLVTMIGKIK